MEISNGVIFLLIYPSFSIPYSFFTGVIREVIDIAELNANIARIVARENKLRSEIDLIIKEIQQ